MHSFGHTCYGCDNEEDEEARTVHSAVNLFGPLLEQQRDAFQKTYFICIYSCIYHRRLEKRKHDNGTYQGFSRTQQNHTNDIMMDIHHGLNTVVLPLWVAAGIRSFQLIVGTISHLIIT